MGGVKVKSLAINFADFSYSTALATYGIDSKYSGNLDHYEVAWMYTTGAKYTSGNRKGQLVWVIEAMSSNAKRTQSSYSVPNGATQIGVKVKPIAKKDKKNKSKFTGEETKVTIAVPAKPKETVAGAAATWLDQFGTSGRTVIGSWTWDKYGTTSYDYEFAYSNDRVNWAKTSGNTTDSTVTYDVPSGAVIVRFRLKPVGIGWVAPWSGWVYYETSNFYPETPPTPTVSITGTNRLTAYVNIYNSTANRIHFQIVEDDANIVHEQMVGISTNRAEIARDMASGHRYKVRCAALNPSGRASSWSDYSDNHYTAPAAPGPFTTYKAISGDSVELRWGSSPNADSYTVEYTNNKNYFDKSPGNVQSVSITAGTTAIITGLEDTQGNNIWYFRCKAVKDNLSSGWNAVVSVTVGRKPAVPTTWSLKTSVKVGEPIKLYWVHNSRDNSKQTYYRLKLTINGTTQIINQQDTRPDDEKDNTFEYVIQTTGFNDNTVITWSVQTKGLHVDYSDYSITRTIKVYSPSTLQWAYQSGESFPTTVTALPIHLRCQAGPNTRNALRYTVTLISLDSYEISDDTGVRKQVHSNEELYSKVYNPDSTTPNILDIELGADKITIENGKQYKVVVTVVMSSGLDASCDGSFTVEWDDERLVPNAIIGVDETTLIASITPYCIQETIEVESEEEETEEETESETETEEEEDVPIERVTTVLLSVYRRNYDGTFTPVMENLDGEHLITATDPHVALDYARYRIVAKSKITAQVFYSDLPGIYVGSPCIVIQWDEAWTEYDYFDIEESQSLDVIPWTGSMIRLPYNVDVSENRNPDVELIKYIGREHPVSYFGTQRGETAVWNTVIETGDYETLYQLRRLASYMGNCYVREPSGAGYWAYVIVDISKKHAELTIPITFNITRVEGGA